MLLYVAAKLVHIIRVFDGRVYRVRIVLANIDQTVLFQRHQGIVNRIFDVVGRVQPPTPCAVLPVPYLFRQRLLRLEDREGVGVDGIYIVSVVRE